MVPNWVPIAKNPEPENTNILFVFLTRTSGLLSNAKMVKNTHRYNKIGTRLMRQYFHS